MSPLEAYRNYLWSVPNFTNSRKEIAQQMVDGWWETTDENGLIEIGLVVGNGLVISIFDGNGNFIGARVVDES